MIGPLILGIFLAGLLFLLLSWWANTEVKSAKTGLFWLIIAIAAVITAFLFARGFSLMALVPGVFTLWKLLNGVKFWHRLFNGGAEGGRDQTVGRGTIRLSRKEALEVLGLEEGATKTEINTAYKRLMAQCHPDKGGSDWMAAKLSEARKVLLGS